MSQKVLRSSSSPQRLQSQSEGVLLPKQSNVPVTEAAWAVSHWNY